MRRGRRLTLACRDVRIEVTTSLWRRSARRTCRFRDHVLGDPAHLEEQAIGVVAQLHAASVDQLYQSIGVVSIEIGELLPSLGPDRGADDRSVLLAKPFPRFEVDHHLARGAGLVPANSKTSPPCRSQRPC